MKKENNDFSLFKTVFDKTAVGIAQITPDGQFVKLNDKFCEIVGYSENGLLNKNFRDITHPEDIHLDEKHITEVLAGKKDAFEIEKRYIHKNGEIIWIKLYSNVQRKKDGTIDYAVASIINITKRKEAEEALRESEKQKDLILNSSAEMIAYYDTDLRIIWSNRASAESVGLSAKDLVGKHCYEIWNNRNSPCAGCPVLKAKDTKKPEKTEQLTPDGRHWYIRGYPVLDDNKNVIALVEFGQDITEQKKNEKAIRDNEMLLRTMADNFPNSYISIIEKDFTIGFSSGQAFKKQNLNPEDFIGLKIEDVFGAKTKTVKKHYKKTFEGKEQSFELFINKQHQYYRTVPLYSEDGSIPRILAVVENITERKKAENELQKHRKHLEELVKERTSELEEKNKELERFNKLFIGREFRIKELRDQVKELKKKLAKYNDREE